MVYGILKLLNFAHGRRLHDRRVHRLRRAHACSGGAFNPAIPAGAGGALIVLGMFVAAMTGSGLPRGRDRALRLPAAAERAADRAADHRARRRVLPRELDALLFGSKFRTYNGFDLVSYNGIHIAATTASSVQYLGLMVIISAVVLMLALLALVRWTQLGEGDARGLVRPGRLRR
jgi:hypothetical protein